MRRPKLDHEGLPKSPRTRENAANHELSHAAPLARRLLMAMARRSSMIASRSNGLVHRDGGFFGGSHRMRP